MSTRRNFLRNVATGMAAVTTPAWLPRGLQPVSLAEAQLASEQVQFRPDMEPIVRLLEETPRDRLLEEVAGRIKKGSLSYRQVVAALMLAGVRNVQPRPSVGFKFHTVLVVNSAHLASINSPDNERWLPIFWALDYFKHAQADEIRRGEWKMSGVDPSRMPPLRNARAEFIQAMDDWDPEKADAAVAALCRVASVDELFELMAGYGCRDFRDIGHKSIYVANAFRTLNCIGWQHAEPIMRSLTFALQCRGNDSNPATSDLLPDLPNRLNSKRLTEINANWQDGTVDAEATRRLNEILHDCDHQQAAQGVVDQLNAGASPQSIFDSLYVTAGEMLMRQPGIVSLHGVTMTNALGYAYRRVSRPESRLKIMLQNASFLAMFLDRMKRDPLPDSKATGIIAASVESDPGVAVESILHHVSRDNPAAASEVLGLLNKTPTAADALFSATRRMVFLKGTGTHDYKYSSAVLEDYYNISPAWRNYYAATSVYKLKGSQEPDTDLLPRIRSALA